MGVVYEAYDPELDRRVAVKLLHDAGGDSDSRSGGQRRLLREAQAMARLTHPNVITVHDVGVHDDRVFVAMEFIEGQTLSQWRREVHRVEAILEVFSRAAAGLQAAHDAGLVHRDFKPDNVMLGKGGELRVMDFGLARRTGAPAPAPPTAAATYTTLDETQTEGLAGTPAYMAPEQHAGQDITPQTDQFSFCVALFEALYGHRPFTGDTPAALAFEVLEGHVRPPSRAALRRVPRRVHRAVLRGLSVPPEERFVSMRELVDALRPRRRPAPWIVAAAGGVGLTAWVIGTGPADAASCEGAQRQMQSQWNDAARERVTAGLSGRPWSEQVGKATLEGLDAYADAWVEAGTGLCRQARAESISPRVFDLGMACLQRRSSAMIGLVDSLAVADDALAEAATTAVGSLRSIQPCLDASSLLAEVPPPADPAVAAEVEALRAQIAQVEVLLSAGRATQARRRVEGLGDRVAATGYEPVALELAAVSGRALAATDDPDEAREVLEDAFWRASAIKHDLLAAEVAVELLELVGERFADFDAARDWERQASTAVARVGPDHAVAIDLHLASAEVAATRGEPTEAVHAFERAAALLPEHYAEDHPKALVVRQGLAAMLIKDARYDEAAEALVPILETLERLVGPEHPAIARCCGRLGAAELKRGNYGEAQLLLSRAARILEPLDLPTERGAMLHNLSIVLRRRGLIDEAAAAAEQAVVAMERAYGGEHVRYAVSLSNLAAVESARGRYETSLEIEMRALAVREAALGPDHPDLARALEGIVSNLVALDRTDEAIAYSRRALALLAALPDDHPRTAIASSNLAGILLEQGEGDEAERLLLRALEIDEKVLGPDHPTTASVLVGLARTHAWRGQGASSLTFGQRAVAIYEAGADPLRLLDARFAVAQGYWARDEDGDRQRALTLARTVADELETLGPRAARAVVEVRGWLGDRDD